MRLSDYLAGSEAGRGQVGQVVTALAEVCASISKVVASGALANSLGGSGQINVQDEEQKALDVITNDMVSDALKACAPVAGLASEELETIEATGRTGGVLVTFDPLDGSSNIDVNVSVGTIFSVLPAPDGRAPGEADFLQPGRNQLAAGYAVYGPQAMLVLTLSEGVAGFTLNSEGEWIMTHDAMTIPADTKEFAINMSNQRHWAAPIQAYVEACLLGKTGPRGKDFNMRWIASMVADVHRIMIRGGIFMYPWDAREPNRPGKLRLLYEANPMSLLVERAGGKSSNTQIRILDLQPTSLHERVSVVLGSANEVAEVVK